ncbi:MAG: helix-turn-helix domain-containing protein [Oliverpabstia sp.]
MNFEELMFQAQNGDPEAKEKLFLMYRPMLLARATVGGKFSEDLFQELSKTFLVCIDRFDMQSTDKF